MTKFDNICYVKLLISLTFINGIASSCQILASQQHYARKRTRDGYNSSHSATAPIADAQLSECWSTVASDGLSRIAARKERCSAR